MWRSVKNMSVTLEFIIGDPSEIGKIVHDMDCDRLDEVSKRRADFSLHLTPHDLDTLSRESGLASAQSPRELGPYLKGGVDEVDRGVLEVEEEWVGYVARVPQEKFAAIAEQWAKKMRDEQGDPEIVTTDEMKLAILELVGLCVAATRDSARVVHIWLA
jgi:hypothetical protein